MIKQMKYFQAVVRTGSFTKAAEECFISQSAISQQIQALERELGVNLMHREKRNFSLTPAGEHFYKKSLIIVSDFDRLREETVHIASGGAQDIIIGYLKAYCGQELRQAIPNFHENFPDVYLKLKVGTHEELYNYLRSGKVDVAFSDLRRVPSEQYVNFYLARGYFYVKIPAKNPLASLRSITPEELKNTPCILVSSLSQKLQEETFYREYLGLKSEFIFAESMEEAYLMMLSGQGYLPVEFHIPPTDNDEIRYLPVMSGDNQLYRDYYAFWRIDNTKPYLKDFADFLKSFFPEESEESAE